MKMGTTRWMTRVVDQEAGDFGMLESPNTVVNSPEFRRAVQTWARTLRECFDATIRRST